ncbi:MAG: ATP-binding protein [Burkholderiaceae bacterium]|jgi:two-component system osmolarity sensor histidine kinase EnvZ|nr:HAMP domain-containing protein [Betaproteobacteria bacterium]
MTSSLFGRTFLLIAGLLVASLLGAWLVMNQRLGPTPEQSVAWEVASLANVTKVSLETADPESRKELLSLLDRREGLRLIPRSNSDHIVAFDRSDTERNLTRFLKLEMGDRTQIMGSVNGLEGLWVSITIRRQAYWLGVQQERLERSLDPPWEWAAAIVLLLSLLGAVLISQQINRPLRSLARAITGMESHRPSPQLPENLPGEFGEVNRRFNHMTKALEQLEHDRQLALAGISHDIRTPLTRLRMEIELASIGPEVRANLVDDIERIDSVVRQFIDYARAAALQGSDTDDAAPAVREAVERWQDDGLRISLDCPAQLPWLGRRVDVDRLLDNLLSNIARYARSHGEKDGNLRLRSLDGTLSLELEDFGEGVPEHELSRLIEPFARLEAYRSDREGTGLGLAIVNRIVLRHQGSLELHRARSGGLAVRLQLPSAKVIGATA